MYFFSMENPFFRFVGKCVDLVWLNILTVICCIPVVTAGAAFAAMCHVLLRMVKNEESGITREYFRALKRNFRQATGMYLPVLVLYLILGYNAYLLRQGVIGFSGQLFTAAGISIGILFCVLTMFLLVGLSLITRYDVPLKRTVNNAFRILLAFFPKVLCMLFILLSPVALMLLSDYFFWLFVLYGFSFPGFFAAMLLWSIFEKLEQKASVREG